MRDLGNGFAEETCWDVPTMCTRTEQVCDAAVYDDWCTWTVLRWDTPKQHVTRGGWDEPRWPTPHIPSDAAITRTEHYTVVLDPLAGVSLGTDAQVDETSWASVKRGDLAFVTSGHVALVPPHLRPPPGPRYDCEDGVERDILATRDWCTWRAWRWVQEPPLITRGGPEDPWPDGRLSNDGREQREEWLAIELTWTRDEIPGSTQLQRPTEQWEPWRPGTNMPVIVDYEAKLKRLIEDPPGTPLVHED